MKVLVAGAGGFIGGHLVGALLDRGDDVRAIDIKSRRDWWQLHEADNWLMDLRDPVACGDACDGMERVFNLAADMGGIGYIESHKAECMRSVLINTSLIEAARREGVERYLFTSSACVYPQHLQSEIEGTDDGYIAADNGLAESDAYPADPEDGYGWEKLFSERMCRHYQEASGMETRVARLHNVYGPHGTWNGGREKAPAAICRKVAEAKETGSGEIEIWGDGEQTRSFMFIEDCLDGLELIMDGPHSEPVNLGSPELVTITQLHMAVSEIAGLMTYNVKRNLDAPQGVRGRNSDNTLIKERYGWEPSTPLSEGLVPTYEWVAEQVNAHLTTGVERSDWPMPAWGESGNVKQVLVTTTIRVPEVLRRYRQLGPDVPMIVVGDRMVPDGMYEFCHEVGAEFLSWKQQEKLYPALSEAIGWNNIQRRNIAILEAAKLEPDVIVSVDDDNIPLLGEDYFGNIAKAFARPHHGYEAKGEWFNIGALADQPFTYRGFPYRFLEGTADYRKNGSYPMKVGILNGLIFGDPDCNAVERIATNPQVHYYSSKAQRGIAVDPSRTWTPINAQNTAYRGELAPLMLQLPHIGRYDDIFGSYIGQRVLAGSGYHVLFGRPFVKQERNEHDLEQDRQDEEFGATFVMQLTAYLRHMEVPQGSVLERLSSVLSGLQGSGMELPYGFFSEWLAAWKRL